VFHQQARRFGGQRLKRSAENIRNRDVAFNGLLDKFVTFFVLKTNAAMAQRLLFIVQKSSEIERLNGKADNVCGVSKTVLPPVCLQVVP